MDLPAFFDVRLAALGLFSRLTVILLPISRDGRLDAFLDFQRITCAGVGPFPQGHNAIESIGDALDFDPQPPPPPQGVPPRKSRPPVPENWQPRASVGMGAPRPSSISGRPLTS